MDVRTNRTWLVLAALLASCAAPTLDGTSDETLEASVGQMSESLDGLARERFDSAVMVVGMSGLSLGSLLLGGAPAAAENILQRFDGLTAAQVVALADSITEAARLERVRQARAEIAELEAQRAEATSARERMSGFVVERSRFRMRERQFLGPEAIIELTVRNGLDVAVSRAYFIGTLQSPGRSVPWIKETFNYTVPGGVEPGETVTWYLAPNQFGPWGRASEAPADAVLTVKLDRLDGADGEALFGGSTWGEGDQQRLEALLASLEDAGETP